MKVYQCVAGFAQLYAEPNPAADGSPLQGDQFYLQFTGGKWRLLLRGAAVDCGDGNPKLLQACAAFAKA